MPNTVISAKLLPLLQEAIEVKLSTPIMNMDGIATVVAQHYVVRWKVDYIPRGVRGDQTIDVPAEEYNYFCFSKANRITCWPTKAGIQPTNDRGQWRLEGRQEIKPGKFYLLFSPWLSVRTVLGSIVTDPVERARITNRACEVFADRIRGMNEELAFEISTDIGAIYRSDSHNSSGYLCNSCMRPHSGHGCHKYSCFYNHVPDLKIVYRKSPSGELLFRALLWENLQTIDGDATVTFLDRIYASDPIMQRLLTMAQERGWAYRQFSDNRIISPQHGNDINVYKELSVEAVRYLHNTGSPYMDTLYNLVRVHGSDKAVLTNNPDEYIEKHCTTRSSRCNTIFRSVQSTSGGTVIVMDSCSYCNKMLTKRTTKHLDNATLCTACYKRHVVTCERCHEPALDSSMHLWGSEGKNICGDCVSSLNLHRCAYCGNFYDNCAYVTETDEWACRSCISKFPKCACCGLAKPPHILQRIWADKFTTAVRVCRSCRESTLVQCGGCGKYYSGVLRFQPWGRDMRARTWSCECEHHAHDEWEEREPRTFYESLQQMHNAYGYGYGYKCVTLQPPDFNRLFFISDPAPNVVAVPTISEDSVQLVLDTWREVVNV